MKFQRPQVESLFLMILEKKRKDREAPIEKWILNMAGYIDYEIARLQTPKNRAGSLREIDNILKFIESQWLKGVNIHFVVRNSELTWAEKLAMLRYYYAGLYEIKSTIPKYDSALLRDQPEEPPRRLWAKFGDQIMSDSYLSELHDLNTVYPSLISGRLKASEKLLVRLSSQHHATGFFRHGFNITAWLDFTERRPNNEYILSTPIGFPLVGLTQLARFEITCKVLGLQPGVLRGKLSGVNGGYQGLIVAVVVAAADSWDSWPGLVDTALEVLLSVGVRKQQVHAYTDAPLHIDGDVGCAQNPHDEKCVVSPMVSVRADDSKALEQAIKNTRRCSETAGPIFVSMLSTPGELFVSGPAPKLPLREEENGQRYQRSTLYRPATPRIHRDKLERALESIARDLEGLSIPRSRLMIPVLSTQTGQDLREGSGDTILELVRLLVSGQSDEGSVSKYPGATHVLDFGFGSPRGSGMPRTDGDIAQPKVIPAGTLISLATEVHPDEDLFAT